jgi:hypothetical protein
MLFIQTQNVLIATSFFKLLKSRICNVLSGLHRGGENTFNFSSLEKKLATCGKCSNDAEVSVIDYIDTYPEVLSSIPEYCMEIKLSQISNVAQSWLCDLN